MAHNIHIMALVDVEGTGPKGDSVFFPAGGSCYRDTDGGEFNITSPAKLTFSVSNGNSIAFGYDADGNFTYAAIASDCL